MSSSQNERKNSDVEMGEASPVMPIPANYEDTPTFVAGFLSFKERLSRRSAEKEASRTHAETSAIPSSSALSSSDEGNKSPGGAAPLVTLKQPRKAITIRSLSSDEVEDEGGAPRSA
ncbi:hypothetical protein Bca52824_023422 [Brassica carinata]|uniref:Uncharacterized protein n=1 Tax=Brassica carinata TaxID=52824 RepID=A0A8X7VJ06_BRACI|nr:hypothetical protein Bca52824_023422 [Brassica carinata]